MISFRWRGSWKMSGWCLVYVMHLYLEGPLIYCCTWPQWPARFTKDMQNVPSGDLISKLFGNGSLARWFSKLVRFGEIHLQEIHSITCTGIGNHDSCQVWPNFEWSTACSIFRIIPSISFHQELPLMSSESSTSWIMSTSVSWRFEVCSLCLRRIADGKSPTTFWKLPSPSGAWRCFGCRTIASKSSMSQLSEVLGDFLAVELTFWNWKHKAEMFVSMLETQSLGFVSLICLQGCRWLQGTSFLIVSTHSLSCPGDDAVNVWASWCFGGNPETRSRLWQSHLHCSLAGEEHQTNL